MVTASDDYAAGALHRRLLGDNYRDLWGQPIKVPVLDLRTFAGGLKATKTGGGKQTRNLRFESTSGREYVFRPAYKALVNLPDEFKGTIIWDLFLDQRSSSYPTAPLGAPPVMAAARLLHPTPVLVAMPDDPALGEFRKEFGGLLGMIEEVPDASEKVPGFAGAAEIIGTESLLKKINSDPKNQVDARTLLTARLVDMLIGDNDRHPGQWRWARFGSGASAEWVPIARDRDKVFLSYEGLLLDFARRFKPSLVEFDSAYSAGSAQFENTIEFDRRLLAGLDRTVWDSVAQSFVRLLDDRVLDASVRAMPREYSASFPEISAKLRARRNALPAAARAYYDYLAKVVDIHGTDANDHATVTRAGEGLVDVRIQSGSAAPWFQRRFDARETRNIRVYLHDGDDVAVVTGTVQSTIPVRIIGGNGNNTLVDSSRVSGRANPTRLHESGVVRGVRYEPDSVPGEKREVDESVLRFNRLPWVRAYGKTVPAERDRGASVTPIVGLGGGHGLGLVPRIGIARYSYGFRKVPYASLMQADLAYSTGTNRFAVGVFADKRFESSPVHALVNARMSQIEVVEFRGFGNDVPELEGDFYDVRQSQWSFRPAVGLTLGRRSEFSLGPILRYTITDSTANRFISQLRPSGFPEFGQLGLHAALEYDTRNETVVESGEGLVGMIGDPRPPKWGKLQLLASAYPGVWDVDDGYQDISAVATTFITLPVGTRPVLALRAGGKKLFGDFPYFDAAFLGGGRSLRTEHRQRYAGDASLFGTTELRVPIAKFPLILPLNVGALGFVDVGRVYMEGESPGGWHTGTGAGFWVGVVNPELGVTVTVTNNPDRRILLSTGFAF